MKITEIVQKTLGIKIQKRAKVTLRTHKTCYYGNTGLQVPNKRFKKGHHEKSLNQQFAEICNSQTT